MAISKIGSNSLNSALTFTGQQTIPTINLTGGQITFPATAVPSSDANTLDDYEEGTWTPSITGGVSNPTVVYTSQVGYYTKIGNQVTAWWFMNRSSASGGSGALLVSGFPFAVKSTAQSQPYWGIVDWEGVNFGSTVYHALMIGANGTACSFSNNTSGTSWGGIQCSALVSGGWFCGTISYQTN